MRVLASIVEDHERKRWPIEPPGTVEAIRYRMETGGLHPRSVRPAQPSLFPAIDPVVTDDPHRDGGEKAANHQIDRNQPRRSA